LVALLDGDGGLGLALRGARVHGVADPAVGAECVANADFVGVGVTEALILGCTIGAKDAALVEFVAFVENEGVRGGEGKSEKAGKGK
jgi:hypothetical protein